MRGEPLKRKLRLIVVFVVPREGASFKLLLYCEMESEQLKRALLEDTIY